jgi:hypothetical protein
MKTVLYCLAPDDATAAAFESWRVLPRLDVGLVVDRPSPTEPVPALAARVSAAMDGRDYALLAYSATAGLLRRVLPALRTTPRCRRVFLLDAAAPDQGPADGPRWPVSVICAASGTPATPSAVAGWQRYGDASFCVQVFDDGRDLLRRRRAEIVESIHHDLGLRFEQALLPDATPVLFR